MRVLGWVLVVMVVTGVAGGVAVCLADLSDAEVVEHLKVFLSSGKEAERDAALAKLVTVGSKGVARLEKFLSAGQIYGSQPTGVLDRQVHLEITDTPIDYVLCVPKDYRPERSYPLLVVLHGTGGTGRGFYNRWYKYVEGMDVIVAAPTCETPQRTKGYGATEAERQIPLAVVRDVCRDYHVDSNRVYLAGCSMGGHATWDSLLTYTDHYAAGIVEAGVPMVEGFQVSRSIFYTNLDGAGVYVMQGTPDQEAPEINRDAVDRLKRLGKDAVYMEFAGAGHGVYEAGSKAALEWLWSHQRDPWPKKVSRTAHRLRQARASWVRVDQMKGEEWDPRKQTKVRAERNTPKEELIRLAAVEIDKELIHIKAEVQSGNRVVITCSRATRLTVGLHPALVDFDKPVQIVVNGKTAFSGKVEADPAVLLKAAARELDFQRLPYAEISVPVR